MQRLVGHRKPCGLQGLLAAAGMAWAPVGSLVRAVAVAWQKEPLERAGWWLWSGGLWCPISV